MITNWPDAYATVGITPADLRMWRVVLLRAQRDPAPVRLIPAAKHIIQRAPQLFRHGKRYRVRELAASVGYSWSQTYRALGQLVETGHVLAVPLGEHNHGYAGNPAQLLYDEWHHRNRAA